MTPAQNTKRRPKRNCLSSIPSRAKLVTLLMVMKSDPSGIQLSGTSRWGVLVKLNASKRKLPDVRDREIMRAVIPRGGIVSRHIR